MNQRQKSQYKRDLIAETVRVTVDLCVKAGDCTEGRREALGRALRRSKWRMSTIKMLEEELASYRKFHPECFAA